MEQYLKTAKLLMDDLSNRKGYAIYECDDDIIEDINNSWANIIKDNHGVDNILIKNTVDEIVKMIPRYGIWEDDDDEYINLIKEDMENILDHNINNIERGSKILKYLNE